MKGVEVCEDLRLAIEVSQRFAGAVQVFTCGRKKKEEGK